MADRIEGKRRGCGFIRVGFGVKESNGLVGLDSVRVWESGEGLEEEGKLKRVASIGGSKGRKKLVREK